MALTTAQPSRARQPPPMRRGGTSRIAGVYLLALAAALALCMGPAQLPSSLHNFGSGPGVAGAVIAGSTVTGTLGTPAFPQLRRRPAITAITTVSITLLGAGRDGRHGRPRPGRDARRRYGRRARRTRPQPAPERTRSRRAARTRHGGLPRTVPLAPGPPTPRPRDRPRSRLHLGGRGAGCRRGPALAGLPAGLTRRVRRVRDRPRHTPTTSLTETNDGKGAPR